MSNPLVPNPVTGFLESNSPHDVCPTNNHFTSDRKLRLLALIDECIRDMRWPTINQICATIGISLRTFQDHLGIDKAFAQEWQERRLQLMSVYTKKLADKADSKMGTLANLAMLRWLETGSWSPETRVNHVSDPSAHKSLVNGLNRIMDAEIITIQDDNQRALPSPGDAQK